MRGVLLILALSGIHRHPKGTSGYQPQRTELVGCLGAHEMAEAMELGLGRACFANWVQSH